MTHESETPEGQARVSVTAKTLSDFDGTEVEVDVVGAPDDSADDVNDVAAERFEDAVKRRSTDDSDTDSPGVQ